MKKKDLKILVLEDSPDDAELMQIHLTDKDFTFKKYEIVYKENDFKHQFENEKWDLIILDYNVPLFQGDKALNYIREQNDHVPVIIVSGSLGEENVVELLKMGANDFLLKRNLFKLSPTIVRALEEAKIKKDHLTALNKIIENEKQLNQQLLFTNQLIEALPNPVFYKNMEGIYTGCNNAFAQYIGKNKNDIVGKTVFELYRKDLAEIYEKNDTEMLAVQKYQQYETKVEYADGSLRDVIIYKAPIYDINNKIKGLIGHIVDISDRKEVESALIESEQKFRNIADNVPGLVLKYKLNADGTDQLLYLSKSVEDIYEIPYNEAVNNVNLLWERIYKGDLKEYVKSIEESAKNLSFWEAEHRIQMPDGRIKWIHARGTPQKNEDGSIIWDTLGLDITATKNAQQEQQETEEKFRKMASSALSAIIMMDSDGRINYWNQSAEKIFGYSLQESIGKDLHHLLAPNNYWDAHKKAFPHFVKTGEGATIGKTMELEGKRKDGEVFPIELALTSVKIKGKWNAIGFINDISERIKAEKEIKESQRKLSTLMANLPGMAYRCQNDGFYTMHFVSEGVERLTGYTEDELINNNKIAYIELIEDEFKKKVRNKVNNSVAEKKQFEIVYPILTKSGKQKWILEKGQPIFENNEFLFIEGFCSDITKLKDFETQLKKSVNALSKRTNEIEGLLHSARAILEEDNFENTVRRIFDKVSELIGSKSGYVTLLSEKGDENEVLFLEAGGLECTVDENLPMPLRGLRAEACKKKKAVYENNFSNSKWMKFMPEGHVDLKNVLFAPLLINNVAVGLLGIANKNTDFTDEDARLAEAFAELAAIALKNTQTHDALEQSEERYKRLINEMHEGMGLVDLNENILFVNPAFSNIMGYPESELIGSNLKKYILKEDWSKIENETKKRAKGDSNIYQVRIRRKDQQERVISVSSVPWKNNNNKIVGTIGMIMDITDRVKSLEDLKKRFEYEKIVFEITSRFINSKDFDNKINLSLADFGKLANAERVQFVNFQSGDFSIEKEWYKEGYKPKENEFKSISLDNLPWGYELLSNKNIIVIDDINTLPPEAIAERKIFEETDVKSYLGFPIFIGTDLIGMLGIVNFQLEKSMGSNDLLLLRTISEIFSNAIQRQFSEKQIDTLNNQLIKKNQELEQVIYTTSHDLRSPLVNIMGFGKELQLTIEELNEFVKNESKTEEQLAQLQSIVDVDIPEILEYINSSGKKIDGLLNALLKLSRTGREELHITNVKVKEIVESVLESFEYLIGQEKISVTVEELPSCKADANLLNQVISNIIDNAIKYSHPERTNSLRIYGYEEDAHVIYGFEDKGIGIASENLKSIFQIFYREKNNESEGEGIGLSIITKIMDKLDGEIWCTSEYGKGTTFFLKLKK